MMQTCVITIILDLYCSQDRNMDLLKLSGVVVLVSVGIYALK